MKQNLLAVVYKTLKHSFSVKTISLIAFLIICSYTSYGQVDTVFSNNQKIACNVKEITPDAIKYTFPGEDIINSVYKNTVQKIVFKSGRIQSFAESTSLKTLAGVMDYNKVTITSLENEVAGLFKLTDVSSKAKGTTVYSSQERVKDRAYRKIKLQAAMFGANIIYLTNQRTEGNKYGGYFQSGSSAETNLTGIAYSNVLPSLDKLKELVGSNKQFTATEKFELGASDSDVSDDVINKPFTIADITADNGVVLVNGYLKGEDRVNSFQLARITDNTFSVAYKYKGTAYNIVIKVK